eukprot:4832239-Lingulodinium_polyedra.AAC.1
MVQRSPVGPRGRHLHGRVVRLGWRGPKFSERDHVVSSQCLCSWVLSATSQALLKGRLRGRGLPSVGS